MKISKNRMNNVIIKQVVQKYILENRQNPKKTHQKILKSYLLETYIKN